MIMDGQIVCRHLLLFVLCVSLQEVRALLPGPLMNISKIFPPGDPFTVRENDLLKVRCDASDLLEGNVMEWSTLAMGSLQTVARNGTSLVPGYEIEVLSSSLASRMEVLTVHGFLRNFSSNFIC